MLLTSRARLPGALAERLMFKVVGVPVGGRVAVSAARHVFFADGFGFRFTYRRLRGYNTVATVSWCSILPSCIPSQLSQH